MVIILDSNVSVPEVFKEQEIHYIDLDLVHSLENLTEDKALTIYKMIVENEADLVIVQDERVAKRLRQEDVFVYIEG